MDVLTPHWECVSAELKEILLIVGQQSFAERFYLAGGTALALQIGHRVSVDLDFFSATDELPDDSRREILDLLQPYLKFKIIQNVDGSILLNVNGIALGFFSYGYPLVTAPVILNTLRLADLPDIGLMKLDGIIGRGVKKDFVDLYFIAQFIPVEKLLEYGAEKYPQMRDFGTLVLESLSDFSVAERQSHIFTTPAIEWDKVCAFCVQEVRRLGNKWFEN